MIKIGLTEAWALFMAFDAIQTLRTIKNFDTREEFRCISFHQRRDGYKSGLVRRKVCNFRTISILKASKDVFCCFEKYNLKIIIQVI